MVRFSKPASPARVPGRPGELCGFRPRSTSLAMVRFRNPASPCEPRVGALRVRAWVTGSAGGANNRSRREGDSGQNAEPTPSARTKPGPSAMAVNNRCRRRVLPRRAPGPPTRQPRWGGYSLFAELALTVGHVYDAGCVRRRAAHSRVVRGSKRASPIVLRDRRCYPFLRCRD